MLYEEINQFLESARKRHIVFFYVGYFSHSVVTAISEVIRVRLENVGAAGSTRRKIFSSFVELSQNIMHYSSDALVPSDQIENQIRCGSLCIGANNDGFFLLSANPVATENIEIIRKALEPLRSMTVDQIKEAYKKALREEAPESSKGAGLGFLTLARDASEPLDFEFVQDPDNPNTTIFCIKAII